MSKTGYRLSNQEERILNMSMTGLSDKQIADELSLSTETVRTYWKRIRAKVGGATRAQLVAKVARVAPNGASDASGWASVVDSLPMGVAEVLDTGEVLRTNRTMRRILGVDMSPRFLFDIVMQKDQERLKDGLRLVLAFGRSEHIPVGLRCVEGKHDSILHLVRVPHENGTTTAAVIVQIVDNLTTL